MKFTGLLLKEGLKDEQVLNEIQITKRETWDIKNATSFQPKTWTAIYFKGQENKADKIAEKLSRSLKPRGWYVNLSTKNEVYVIFPNKIFKYSRGDIQRKEEAIKHGRSLGIPDSQLDWEE